MPDNTFTLPLDDPRSQEILITGWHLKRRAVARAVSDPVILFEYIEDRSRPIGHWPQTLRAFSLTATGTPCLAVLSLSWFNGFQLRIWTGLCALAGVLFLQMAINVFNDVEDYRRLIDLPGTLGGSGVIQKGWWTPKDLKKLGWIALIAGSILGLPAVLAFPLILVPIGLLAGIGVLFYSMRKMGFKYHALGDLVVWILCGPALTLGFSVAVTQSWNSGVLWIGSFFGFLAAALLHVNNLQDMKVDRDRGIDTLAIRLGFKGSLRFLILLYVCAAGSLVAGILLRELPLTALAGCVFSIGIAFPWLKRIRNSVGPESSLLSDCRLKAAKIHLFGGISLVLGLLLGHK